MTAPLYEHFEHADGRRKAKPVGHPDTGALLEEGFERVGLFRSAVSTSDEVKAAEADDEIEPVQQNEEPDEELEGDLELDD